MKDSVLLLFTNSTPICLEWPATTMMIPLFIISFLQMMVQTDFISAIINFDMIKISDAINSHLYHYFNNAELVQTGRILIAFIGIAAYFFMFNFLRDEKKEFNYFFAYLYTISTAILAQSAILHPDSFALIFWILFITYYIFRFNFTNDKSLIILSALFVLLAASKFTYVIFLPILLLSFVFLNIKKYGWPVIIKQTTKFLFISGVLLMALFPFIWTDSITFAKSFFGNIMLKSTGEGNSINLLITTFLPSLITYPGLAFSILGLVVGFKKIGFGKTVFLLITFLLFAYPIANANQAYERYSLSLLPMLLIWSALGFTYVIEKIKNQVIRGVTVTLIVLFSLIPSASIIWGYFKASHAPNNFMACRTWLNENLQEDAKIAMPVSFEGSFYENRNCLSRIIGRNSDSLLITKKLQTQIPAEYRNKPINIKAVILEDLFMDEKKYLDQKAKVKLDFVSTHEPPGKLLDVFYYAENDYRSLHCFTYEEVLNDTTIKYFLTENKEIKNLNLVKKFNEFSEGTYYLYSK